MMCTICAAPVAFLKTIVYVASEDIVNVMGPRDHQIKLNFNFNSVATSHFELHFLTYIVLKAYPLWHETLVYVHDTSGPQQPCQ